MDVLFACNTFSHYTVCMRRPVVGVLLCHAFVMCSALTLAWSFSILRARIMTTSYVSRKNTIWAWVVMALVLDITGAKHVYTLPSVGAVALVALAFFWIVPP